MKKIIYVLFAFSCLLASCKKEEKVVSQPTPALLDYLSAIQQYLREHINDTNYNKFDFAHYRLSKQKNNWFISIALKGKPMGTDFAVLKTDTTGHVEAGRFIQLTGIVPVINTDNTIDKNSFNYYKGFIYIRSLEGQLILNSGISNGFIEAFHPDLFNPATRVSSHPAPDNELPEVIVVGYYNKPGSGSTVSFSDFMMLQGLFNNGGGGSNGDPVVYSQLPGYCANGYGSASCNVGSANPNTQPATVPDISVRPDESYMRPQIDINAWMKCFADIPDDGASCKLTLLGDLPVNNDPSANLNLWSGNTGHCFLQLTKTNGAQTVTQVIGFTADKPLQAIVNPESFVKGKTVDNAGHKYNCAVTMDLTAYGFNTVINKMKSLSASMPYSIVNYDCLDYGLEVFNSVRGNDGLRISKVYSVSDPFSNIANGPKLYTLLDNMVASGSPEAPNIFLGGPVYAGESHGPCN